MAMSREEEKNIGGPPGNVGTGGGGSNDISSGGGAGAGTPDGDTAMSAGDVVTRGDPEKDREKLFPETSKTQNQQRGTERPLEAIPPPKGG